jgi:hypothetical protein
MQLLITQEEVINLSFDDKNFIKAKIKDAVILATQYNWIRPVVGIDFYDELCEQLGSNDLTEDNEALLNDLIKPCLAYYVKYTVAPDLMLEITNKGGQKGNSDYSETMTASERGEKRNSILLTAKSLRKILIDYLDDNKAKFPLYSYFGTNQSVIRGGILLGRRKPNTIEDTNDLER